MYYSLVDEHIKQIIDQGLTHITEKINIMEILCHLILIRNKRFKEYHQRTSIGKNFLMSIATTSAFLLESTLKM